MRRFELVSGEKITLATLLGDPPREGLLGSHWPNFGLDAAQPPPLTPGVGVRILKEKPALHHTDGVCRVDGWPLCHGRGEVLLRRQTGQCRVPGAEPGRGRQWPASSALWCYTQHRPGGAAGTAVYRPVATQPAPPAEQPTTRSVHSSAAGSRTPARRLRPGHRRGSGSPSEIGNQDDPSTSLDREKMGKANIHTHEKCKRASQNTKTGVWREKRKLVSRQQ